jgi:hypothetical protein
MMMVSLAVMMTLAGCEKSNDDGIDMDDDDNGGRLNPPAWFIGEWKREIANPAEDISVKVHNVTVSSGNLDFTYQLEENYLSDFKETTVGDVYTLSYVTKHPADYAVSYKFEPYNDGKMKLTLSMSTFGITTFIYVRK